MTPECTYCVKDQVTAQRHCREKHGGGPLSEVRRRECKVQQLFAGIGKKYFEVGEGLAPGVPPNLRDTLKRSFLSTLESAMVVPMNTDRERTPLVRFMAWDTFGMDIRGDPKRRRAALDLKSQHTSDEHNGIFVRLAVAVDHHFEKASTILEGHPHKLTLAKILVHGKNIPRET
jgi:hypothetical protein